MIATLLKKPLLMAGIGIAALGLLIAGIWTAVSPSPKDSYELPPVSKEEVLLFTETDAEQKIGEVYLQKLSEEKQKIDSNVFLEEARLLYRRHAVLYIDKNNELYMKEAEKEKERLSKDVVRQSVAVSEDESTIAFLTSPTAETYGDLYVIATGKEKEKVASNVSRGEYVVSVKGDLIVYVNRDQELYVRRLEMPESEKITAEVIDYKVSDNGNTLVYYKNDRSIGYRQLNDKGNASVTNNGSIFFNVSSNGKTIAFLTEYNASSNKGELYYAFLGGERQKIASDVSLFHLSEDGQTVIYKNNELSLYVAQLPTAKQQGEIRKEKLASDVLGYIPSASGATVLYWTKDQTSYVKQQGKDRVKVVDGDVKRYDLYRDQALLIDQDNNLNIVDLAGKEPVIQKIASDVEYVQHDGRMERIMYAIAQGNIYTKLKDAEPAILIENANKYQEVWYDNELLYEKKVILEDVTGIWTPTRSGYDYFLDIRPDQTMVLYTDGEKQEKKFEITSNSETSIVLTTNRESEFGSLVIEYKSKDSIQFSYADWGDVLHRRVTQEELDREFAKRVQEKELEREKQAKIDAAYAKGQDMKQKVFTLKADISGYTQPRTSAYAGIASRGLSLLVTDFDIDSNGELWVKAREDGSPTYSSSYWFLAKDVGG